MLNIERGVRRITELIGDIEIISSTLTPNKKEWKCSFYKEYFTFTIYYLNPYPNRNAAEIQNEIVFKVFVLYSGNNNPEDIEVLENITNRQDELKRILLSNKVPFITSLEA